MKVELSIAVEVDGVSCAPTSGTVMMLRWCADS